MVKEMKINGSTILYTEKFENTDLGDYYNYILKKISNNLNRKKHKIKINFSGESLKSDLNVWFQFEHTIIKTSDSLTASVAYLSYLNEMDYVFDYTITNIEHLKNFSEFKNLSDKLIYIPPLNRETILFNDTKNREKLVVTVHNPSNRRNKFFGLGYNNIFNTFNQESLCDKLSDYKILLNVRQTDTNLSLEELRVTPLLFTGILILSEKTLYIEKLPHFKHIIWADYDEIEYKVNDIVKNYAHYKKIHQEGIHSTFNQMQSYVDEQFEKIFKNL